MMHLESALNLLHDMHSFMDAVGPAYSIVMGLFAPRTAGNKAGQLFLIFLTIESIKQSNTLQVKAIF